MPRYLGLDVREAPPEPPVFLVAKRARAGRSRPVEKDESARPRRLAITRRRGRKGRKAAEAAALRLLARQATHDGQQPAEEVVLLPGTPTQLLGAPAQRCWWFFRLLLFFCPLA